MKAAICTKLDGPDAIEITDLAKPVAGPGEVLVRVKAAALNFLDTLITRGKYQFKPELPFSPAAEISGEVAALGKGVGDLAVGQRVCGYIGWGGAREYVAVKRDLLVEVPDGITDAVSAGVSVTFGTAMYGLLDRGRLKTGDTVAVLGASVGPVSRRSRSQRSPGPRSLRSPLAPPSLRSAASTARPSFSIIANRISKKACVI